MGYEWILLKPDCGEVVSKPFYSRDSCHYWCNFFVLGSDAHSVADVAKRLD